MLGEICDDEAIHNTDAGEDHPSKRLQAVRRRNSHTRGAECMGQSAQANGQQREQDHQRAVYQRERGRLPSNLGGGAARGVRTQDGMRQQEQYNARSGNSQ